MENIMKALAEFQKECPAISKEVKNDFGNYMYADLPAILAVINPILQKNNLMTIQPLETIEGIRYIKTILYHLESNEMLESRISIDHVSMKGMNDYQALGSGITYLRRYSLSSILGIVTEVDTDASGEQVKKSSTPEKPAYKKDESPASWLNREHPRGSGNITPDWENAVRYLRGEKPREDGAEPKIIDLRQRFKISKLGEEQLMADVMDETFLTNDLPY